jgi:hypothetical protein
MPYLIKGLGYILEYNWTNFILLIGSLDQDELQLLEQVFLYPSLFLVIHLVKLCVRLQWLGERHSVEPLRK